jgi:hypothetical protein
MSSFVVTVTQIYMCISLLAITLASGSRYNVPPGYDASVRPGQSDAHGRVDTPDKIRIWIELLYVFQVLQGKITVRLKIT